MSVLFCGGELEDFVISGTVTTDTNTSTFRTAYARIALMIAGSATWNANFARVPLSSVTTFGVTARWFLSTISATPFMWFSTGGNARLRLRFNSATPSTIILEKWDGATATTLATTSATVASSTLYRLDMKVTYGTSGRFTLYVNGTQYLDFTGDITAAGATSIDSVELGPGRTSTIGCEWSEVIVTDGEDPRPLSLKTLAPNAAGDVAGWSSGGFADIDEAAASDTDLAVSDTANQVLAVNCTGMPAGSSGLSIRALKSVASAARGASGPSKLALGVRQSSTNGFATGQTLDTGYGAISTMWTTNPVTGAAFTSAEIEAIQLAYRSEA